MIRNREWLWLYGVCGVLALVATPLAFAIDVRAGWLSLAWQAAVYALILGNARRRFRRIAALSDRIDRMAEGRFESADRPNGEGEENILENSIYKLALHLHEKSEKLRQEKCALKDVLSDISHQLKTPLTSLSLMAELLYDEQLPPEKRREFLANLQDGLSRMEWMVLSLLKLAKLDADAVALKAERVSLPELIERAARPLAILLDVRDQRIETEGEPGVSVLCDPQWTGEALTNLIKNASEHAPPGSAIRIAYGENPICAWLSVHDSGPGIRAADRAHIFQRFYKSQDASRESVGIGLSMSLSILRKQNGDIELVSGGEGATFLVKFYTCIV